MGCEVPIPIWGMMGRDVGSRRFQTDSRKLGDQVHSIVKGSDQAKIGLAIVGLDLLMVVMFVQEHDRLPTTGPKALVDAFGLLFHFDQEILIPLDVRSARRADLYECQLLPE